MMFVLFAAPVPWPVPVLAKLGWFRMLNTSARNCTIACSRSRVSLLIPNSAFFRSGPRRKFRGAFPRVPAKGRANIVGSNHLAGLCVITLWRSNEGARSRRSVAEPAAPGLFERERLPMSGVIGKPLCIEKMLAVHHPFRAFAIRVLVLFKARVWYGTFAFKLVAKL